jgi:glycogen(starch) synthase
MNSVVFSYALIGPYSKNSAAQEFEQIPPSTLTANVLETLRQKYGIIVYFGRWLVKGYPRVFLIDTMSSMHNLGAWRYELMAGFEVHFNRKSKLKIQHH